MNKHQVKGRVRQAAGKVKQAVGKATGNRSLRAKGAAKRAGGGLQSGYGDAKRDARRSS